MHVASFSAYVLGCPARFFLGSPSGCPFWPWVFGLLAAWTLGLLTGVLVSCLALSPTCRRSLGYLAQLLAWTLVRCQPGTSRECKRASASTARSEWALSLPQITNLRSLSAWGGCPLLCGSLPGAPRDLQLLGPRPLLLLPSPSPVPRRVSFWFPALCLLPAAGPLTKPSWLPTPLCP